MSFAISPRAGHEDIPDQDAQRVAAMRVLARACLRYNGLSTLIDDVELLVSELVTNAIEHSRGTEITVSLRLDGRSLQLEVSDQTRRPPQVREPDDDAESGRGLLIVAALADSWGVKDDGRSTWCTVAIPDEAVS
ncbi:ATP-binding protein [Streptomyces sp. NBC_01619]|uniref:ATP-binding protein n=1 Tax=Streptomyces sp. NBC_01619 TaxID=2975901 RepID=UPI002257C55A|nr:ATP-binding protein [Streptomyces sp. NBC_01619]MCX4515922.1 ATP-binding protein [Streptomyces sp. NBC_01619]